MLHDSRDVRRVLADPMGPQRTIYHDSGHQPVHQSALNQAVSPALEEIPPAADPHIVHASQSYRRNPVSAPSRISSQMYAPHERGAGDWLAKARPISPRIPPLPTNPYHAVAQQVSPAVSTAQSPTEPPSSLFELTHSKPPPSRESAKQTAYNAPMYSNHPKLSAFGSAVPDDSHVHTKNVLRSSHQQFSPYASSGYENEANRAVPPSHPESIDDPSMRSLPSAYKPITDSSRDGSQRRLHLSSAKDPTASSSPPLRIAESDGAMRPRTGSPGPSPRLEPRFRGRSVELRAGMSFPPQVIPATYGMVDCNTTSQPVSDRRRGAHEFRPHLQDRNDHVPYQPIDHDMHEPMPSHYSQMREDTHASLPPPNRARRYSWLSSPVHRDVSAHSKEADLHSRMHHGPRSSPEHSVDSGRVKTSTSSPGSASPSHSQLVAYSSSQQVAPGMGKFANRIDSGTSDTANEGKLKLAGSRSQLGPPEIITNADAMRPQPLQRQATAHDESPRAGGPFGSTSSRKSTRKQTDKSSTTHGDNRKQHRAVENQMLPISRVPYPSEPSKTLASSDDHLEASRHRFLTNPEHRPDVYPPSQSRLISTAQVPISYYEGLNVPTTASVQQSFYAASNARETGSGHLNPATNSSHPSFLRDGSSRSDNVLQTSSYGMGKAYSAVDPSPQVQSFHLPRNIQDDHGLSSQAMMAYQQDSMHPASKPLTYGSAGKLPPDSGPGRERPDHVDMYSGRPFIPPEPQVDVSTPISSVDGTARDVKSVESGRVAVAAQPTSSFRVGEAAVVQLDPVNATQSPVQLPKSSKGRSQKGSVPSESQLRAMGLLESNAAVPALRPGSPRRAEAVSAAGGIRSRPEERLLSNDDASSGQGSFLRLPYHATSLSASEPPLGSGPGFQSGTENAYGADWRRQHSLNPSSSPADARTGLDRQSAGSVPTSVESPVIAAEGKGEINHATSRVSAGESKTRRRDAKGKQPAVARDHHGSVVATDSVRDSVSSARGPSVPASLETTDRSRAVHEEYSGMNVSRSADIREANHDAQVHADSHDLASSERIGNNGVFVATSGEQFPSQAQPRRQLKVEDALAYLEQVKSQFTDQPNVYHHFLDIMKEFKAQTIDTGVVIKRVSQLFRGHKDLILGFNTFLPPGYTIEITEDEATGNLCPGYLGPRGFNELPQQRRAMDSSDEPGRSSAVQRPTDASSGVAKEDSTFAETSADANAGSRADLKSQKASRPARKHSESKASSQPDQEPVEERHQHESIAHAVSSHEKATSPVSQLAVTVPDRDTRVSLSEIAARDTAEDAVEPSRRDQSSFERALAFMNCLKQRLPPQRFNKILVALDGYLTSPVARTVIFSSLSELMGPENKDLLDEFIEFLPAITHCHVNFEFDPKSSQHRVVDASYIPAEEGVPEAGRSEDLNNVHPPIPGLHRVSNSAELLQFFDDMKLELGGTNSKLYTDFIKCLSLYIHSIITRDELLLMIAELFHEFPIVHTMFLQYFDAVTIGAEDDSLSQASSGSSPLSRIPAVVESNLDEHQRLILYRSKPISEVAAESEIACSPSYRRLPSDYPTLICTGRSSLEKRTINDVWVSVTSGSEDYSFKFMRKNQYEDSLFRCEDDRYELDLVIEANAATILKLEPIAMTIARLPNGEKRRHLLAEGALSPVHFNAIQRIYGESGPDVIQQVKFNPAVAVPIVLERLRDKDEQWRRARLEMNSIWREVGEKNYHRSLDHRSGYFKQVDKKELSSKSLLADILDPAASHTARQAEMTRARGYTIPSGGGKPNNRSPTADAIAELAALGQTDSVPSLELSYAEQRVHQVIFALVRKVITNSVHGRDDEFDVCMLVYSRYVKFCKEFFHAELEGETAEPACDASDTARVVMFGDESVYLFFRLHHLLFERLSAAIQMSREAALDQSFRNDCNEKGMQRVGDHAHEPRVCVKASDLTKILSMNGSSSVTFQVSSGITDDECIFSEYLDALYAHLDGSIDAGKYEDRCRVLLGVDAYCLSTIDKTLAKLVKQVYLVFSEDSAGSEFLSLFHTSCSAIDSTKTWEGMLGVEYMYSIAASAVLRRRRGPGANLFCLQRVRRPQSSDLLMIHVMGVSCNEEEEHKRAEEANAIDEFLGFHVLLGDVVDDSGSPDAADDISKGASGESGSNKEDGEEASADVQKVSKVIRPAGIAGTRKRKTSPDLQVDRDVVGDSEVPPDDVTRFADSGDSSKRLSSCEKGTKRARTTCTSDSWHNAEPDFVRFAGSQRRLGRMVICNKVEYRIAPNSRLCFVDGKSDVLVNLGRKRKWQAADLLAPDELFKRRLQSNGRSRCALRFQSFLAKSSASHSNLHPSSSDNVPNSSAYVDKHFKKERGLRDDPASDLKENTDSASIRDGNGRTKNSAIRDAAGVSGGNESSDRTYKGTVGSPDSSSNARAATGPKSAEI